MGNVSCFFLIYTGFYLKCLTLKDQTSFTSWGEGACLAFVAHTSSDGVAIKMPYGVDVLH